MNHRKAWRVAAPFALSDVLISQERDCQQPATDHPPLQPNEMKASGIVMALFMVLACAFGAPQLAARLPAPLAPPRS